MFGNRVSIGLELHAGGARMAVLSLKPNPTVLRCLDLPIAPGDEGRALTLLEKALQKITEKGANIHMAFSPASGAMRHVLFNAPKLKKSELRAIATRELKRENLLDPAAAFTSIESLGADDGGDGTAQRNLLVALHREPVEEAAKFLAQNKHVVRSATTAPMALLRAASVASLPGDGIVALALLDPRRSSLVVLDQGVPRFFRDIPTSIPNSRDGDEGMVSQALARELDISLVYFAQQFRPKQVDTVLVVGDPTVAERVIEWMEEVPRYRLVRFGPSPKLAVASDVPENLAPFAVAVGAALSPKTRQIPDLLPSDLRVKPERAYMLMGATALAAAFMGWAVYARAGHVERYAAAEARVGQLRVEYDGLKANVAKATEIDTKLGQALRWNEHLEDADLFHATTARTLRRLAEALPENCRYAEIKFATPPQLPPVPPRPGAPPPEPPTMGIYLKVTALGADDGAVASAPGKLMESDHLGSVPGLTQMPPPTINPPIARSGFVEQKYDFALPVRNKFPGVRR